MPALPARPIVLVSRIAEKQQGVVSRAQVLATGMSADAIYRLVGSGQWSFALPGVLRVSPGASVWHQRLAAACKWAGEEAAASHRAAAALLRLDGFSAGYEEISTTRPKDARGIDLQLHIVSSLEGAELTEIAGIPVTCATRTLIDLGSVADADLVELALEDALRRGMTSIPRLEWFVGVHAKRGRRGVGVMRRLLVEKDRRGETTDSGFEVQLYQVLRRARLPLPMPQFTIMDHGRFLARADFAYPDARLAIEAQSYTWHSSRGSWERDQRRANELVAHGWRVINVTWQQLREDPERVVDLIRNALGGQEVLFG